jgi:hypothetical protein
MMVAGRRLLISFAVAVVLAGLFAVGLAMIGDGANVHVPSGHPFSPAEVTLPRCVDRDPIMVSDLADRPRATCDPTGIDLVFPDGYHMKIEPPLDSRSESSWANGVYGPTYSTLNVGIYGVCAAKRVGDNSKSWWWGRAEAVTFCQEGGKDAPTDH